MISRTSRTSHRAPGQGHGRGYRFSVLFLIHMVWLFSGSQVLHARHAYINIKDPFIRKVPVAVTRFQAKTPSDDAVGHGREGARILSDGLAFTGYMDLIDPSRFLERPAVIGVTAADIDFGKWTAIGAELLVTGAVAEQAGNIRLEMRLFDPFKDKLVVGKVYTGRAEDIRTMVHRFCGEINRYLTGATGVFGSRIVFISRVAGNKEVFGCEFDGHNPRRLTRHKSITLSPSLSSDGKRLAYTSYVNGKPDIFIQDLNTGAGVTVNYKGLNITPAWVPGKDQLTATLSLDGDQEIYLLSVKGEVLTRLTRSWGIDVSPRVSPDGKKVAFVSRRGGSPQIYVKDLPDGEVRRVTFQGTYNTSPSWSPQGDRLAYVGIVKNQIDIYVTTLDGQATRLTREQGDNEDPTWSPDGGMIAFSSNRDGISKIFVMTANGANQRQLVDMEGEQTDPDWSPAGP